MRGSVLVALTAGEGDRAEEKQGMNWWKEQQRRRHELRMAQAAAKLGRHEREPAPRLESTSEPAQIKLRVAPDTAREQAAEQESALEEPHEVKRCRP